MADATLPQTAPQGGWRDLFSGNRTASVSVLAGGVLLYAMNLYFTAALMPSIVNEIGGRAFYAWVTTAFVVAAIIASLFVGRMFASLGASRAYIIAFLLFAAGGAASALSQNMPMLIGARVIQGLGGGALAGLGYAVIRSAIPNHLWTRAAALVSAMWLVGTFVGPTLGGMFAQFHAWRWAYASLVIVALLLAYIAHRALPRSTSAASHHAPIPFAALVTIVLAAAALSASAILPAGWPTLASVLLGLALLGGFVLIERRSAHTILPRLAYERGNALKWVYLTVAALCAGVMVETFVPLFGQTLGGLNPLAAGLVGSTLSFGWAGTQLIVAPALKPAAHQRAIQLGPIVLTLGLVAYGLLQTEQAGPLHIAGWALALCIAGLGIGMSYPLLTVAALSSTDDPVEGGKAAAAMATTQLIAYSVASALAGTFVMLGGHSLLASAHYLAFGIAALTALGAIAGYKTARTMRS